MSVSNASTAPTWMSKIYCPVYVYHPVLWIPLINLHTIRFSGQCLWTYHSEVFNLCFYKKHDTWQSHTSAQTISSGLISWIFEKQFSPANDTWQCSGKALHCKAQMYARSFQKTTGHFTCTCFLSCHTACWCSDPPGDFLMRETILILSAPTMWDFFGHRGRLRLGPSMTLAFVLNALLPNYQFHGETSVTTATTAAYFPSEL